MPRLTSPTRSPTPLPLSGRRNIQAATRHDERRVPRRTTATAAAQSLPRASRSYFSAGVRPRPERTGAARNDVSALHDRFRFRDLAFCAAISKSHRETFRWHFRLCAQHSRGLPSGEDPLGRVQQGPSRFLNDRFAPEAWCSRGTDLKPSAPRGSSGSRTAEPRVSCGEIDVDFGGAKGGSARRVPWQAWV